MKKGMNIRSRLLTAALTLGNGLCAQTAGYEYWLDEDLEGRTFVAQTDGQVSRSIDASALTPGVHRFHFRACDARGRWSSPMAHYFLRTTPDRSGNRMAAYAYWVDEETPVRGTMDGNTLSLTLPLDRLVPGVHSLKVRLADTAGQWSSPLLHYFLRLVPDRSDNRLTQYEYWLDDDYAGRQTGAAADGTLQLTADASTLAYGMHRFHYRVADAAGRWSVPCAVYFVRTEPTLAGNEITAYEYWFNAGRTTRVDVTPAHPFTADNLQVRMGEVLPYTVPADYTVDWETLTARCPGDVVFGIRFGDRTGRWTEARTDTFACDAVQQLAAQALTLGEDTEVLNTEPGRIRCYTVEAAAGDSLLWYAGGPCTIDLYGADGTRLWSRSSAAGPLEEKMQVGANGRLYALVYNLGVDTLRIGCDKPVPTALMQTASGAGIRVATRAGQLTVSGAAGCACTVVHVQGYVAGSRCPMVDTETFSLRRGVYLVRITDGDTEVAALKVTIP